MKKPLLFRRLGLMVSMALILSSCRHDYLPEKETYSNSSAFQLTSKRISLNEAKHKDKLISVIKNAEVEIEAKFKAEAKGKVDVKGKVISYGNGVSVDTDHVLYIENGPNYHTYTFAITREGAPADAPVENLVLSPLTDGTYRELLVTYTLTPAEKESIANGFPVDTKGKVSTTELAQGTYNSGGQLARMSCNWQDTTVWEPCSENLHDGSNFQDCRFYTHPDEGTPPRAYIVQEFKCLMESDPGPGSGGGGGISGGSGGSGGGSNQNPPTGAPTYPCDGSGISTGPQQPILTDGNGTCSGTPTMPILPVGPSRITPCERIITENQKAKEYYNKAKFQSKLAEAKATIITDTQEKGFSFGVKDGEEAVTNVITGASDSINLVVQSSALTVYGAGHTHNKGNPDDLSISSFMDVYFFLQAHNGIPEINYNGNPDFKYYYTFTHDGNEYVFTITNPTDFKNFLGIYPPNEYANPNTRMWNEFTDMGKDAELVIDYFTTKKGKSANESAENALAYILTKYNSGVGFSKKDSNGDFKPIFVKELPDPTNPQSKIYEKTNDCNLK